MSEDPSEDHIFEGKMKEYEQVLVDFFLDIGTTKSASETIQTIIAYMAIHQSLTQKQLKDLTGYASGTISKSLKVLTNPILGLIKREDIPHKQEKVYTMEYLPKIFQQGSLMIKHIFTGLLQGLEKYLSVLDIHREEKGYDELSNRIQELLGSFEGVLDVSNDIIDIFNPDT